MKLVGTIEKQILELGEDFDVRKSRGQQTLVNVLTIRKYADLECSDAGPEKLLAQYDEMSKSNDFAEISEEALDGDSVIMTTVRGQSIFGEEDDEYGGEEDKYGGGEDKYDGGGGPRKP